MYYDLLISYMFFKVFLFVFLTLRLLFLATYCALSLPIVQFLPSSILLNLIWRGVSNQINKLVWTYKEISKWEFVDSLLSEGHELYCLDFVSPILAFHASFFFTSWFWIVDIVQYKWINVVLSGKLSMKPLWTLLRKWSCSYCKVGLFLICMWVSGKGLSLPIAVLLLTETSFTDLGDFILNYVVLSLFVHL